MITLTINGKVKTLECEMGLLEFLEANNIRPQLIAVEYNGEILRREQFAGITLREGDQVEIVHMMGGGQGP